MDLEAIFKEIDSKIKQLENENQKLREENERLDKELDEYCGKKIDDFIRETKERMYFTAPLHLDMQSLFE